MDSFHTTAIIYQHSTDKPSVPNKDSSVVSFENLNGDVAQTASADC